jgi:hypothetical protein
MLGFLKSSFRAALPRPLGSTTMGRQQVLWNRIFIFLETCNLWVNKKYDWKEQFKGWRFSMILVRCWCTVWIAFGAFSESQNLRLVHDKRDM